jgi:dipeptidyl aminopeptidase/acylaminoacyl peptidase
MRSFQSAVLLVFISCFLALPAQGQQETEQPDHRGTAADYRRMDQQRSLSRGGVIRDQVKLNWLAGDRLWYQVNVGDRQREWVFVDYQKNVKEPLFVESRLRQAVAKKAGGKAGDATADGPVRRISLSDNSKFLYFQLGADRWRLNRKNYQLKKADDDESPEVETNSLSEIRPSQDGGDEVYLDISNLRKGAVGLFWIDRQGRRSAFGTIKPGEVKSQHTFVGHVWLVEDAQGKALKIFRATQDGTIVIDEKTVVGQKTNSKRPGTARQRQQNRQRNLRGVTSPDQRWEAVFQNHNLFLKNKKTDKLRQVTQDGSAENAFVRRVYWSPDSKKLIVIRSQPEDRHTVHMVESAPKSQLQPKLHSHQYLKPGDNVRRDRPYLIDVKAGELIEVSNELFDNPYSLRDFGWTQDGDEFRFVYNQRGHQVLRYVGINAKSGKTRTIVDETSKTFVHYSGKYFLKTLPEKDELIWMSERDGWNHLYLIDAKTGKVKNQMTKGDWVVRKVQSVDVENRRVFFTASGWYKDQDPYLIHYGHVGFDGSDLTKMTAGNGSHSIEYSPDKKAFIDTFSRVDLPPVRELRSTKTGELLAELEAADASGLKQSGWQQPVPFKAKGRDGKTDIYGVIYLPAKMDPNKKYPVVEYIYAGPHDSFVPKKFTRYRREKAMTELGFIVVQIDGMGTSNRSKAFHDVCWKNLGDSGFPDRIAWMKAAAETYPQMDLERVGIFGGSAGGQSALRAVLAHGDFYDAAVADCGCHDNRMDKIWWNEQWMGWPIGDHYAEQSNVTNAHRLNGNLLLIVGELDRNVDPASTMQVVDALIKADKDFDLLVVPGAGHGIGSGRYGMRRTRDFFVRHLIKAEPRGE